MLAAAIAAALGWFAVKDLQEVVKRGERLLTENVQAVILAEQLRTLSEHRAREVREYLFTARPELFDRARASNVEFERRIAELQRDIAGAEGTQILERVLQVNRLNSVAVDQQLARRADGEPVDRIVADFETILRPRGAEIDAALDAFVAHVQGQFAANRGAVVGEEGRAILLIGLVVASAFGLSIMASVFARRASVRTYDAVLARERAEVESVQRRDAELAQSRIADTLRVSEARTQSIIDNMLGGLLTVDERVVIESANPAAERIFGYGRHELNGQHLSLLVPVPADQADTFMREAFPKAIGRISEWEARRKNGEIFQIELALFEFYTAKGRQFAGSIRDVSERRQVERLKQEFVSTVSHELRTPLTSIRGSLGLLASGTMGELPEDALELIGVAERNTLRLITLINDILDLERLKSGKIEMHFDRVTAATIVERAVEAVGAFAATQDIRLEVGAVTAPPMWADADRLVQVLVNLLSNAIKYSPVAGLVTVAVVPRDAIVEIQVRDRGRGIPVAHREAIFERFSQVESSDARQKGGTGLGLAICKAIVEQHGGAIGVESDEGQGSTFWFNAPAARKVRDDGVVAREADAAVLVFDEDADRRGYIDRTLWAAGFTVVSTPSATEAWSLLRRTHVALAVIVAGCQGSNDLLARIGRHPRLSNLGVVLVGGSGSLPSSLSLDQPIVHLPEHVAEKPLLEGVQSALRDARSREVLLVEDDLPLLHVLTRQLTSQGIPVRTATTARDAIRLAEQRRPGLVVLDVEIPGGDGYRVIDFLRRVPDLNAIPVLVYTGLDLTEAQRNRLRLGPTRFLTKSKATIADFQAFVNELRPASAQTGRARAAGPKEHPG